MNFSLIDKKENNCLRMQIPEGMKAIKGKNNKKRNL